MLKRIFTVTAIGIMLFANIFPNARAQTAAPLTREELQAQIEQKNRQLDTINNQVQTAQKNLEATQNQTRTLQKEITQLNGSIKQLDLNILGDAISVQKLNLEIDSLNYDVKDTLSSIDDKKQAINKLLVELQKNDGGAPNLLMVLLKNGTLADSIMETQSMVNLRSQLSLDIQNLSGLSRTLNDKIKQSSQKKSEVQLHQKNLAVRKEIAADQTATRKITLVQTKNQESTYQQQLADLKKQQDSISDEIGKAEDQLRASFNTGLLPTKRPGVLAWPLPPPIRITQHFGEKSYLYRNKPHNGLDIGIPIGTPVFAADDGAVVAVDNNDRSSRQKYQYGKYILIKHDNNLTTLYAHLSRQIVSAGANVKRGDLIGYSGNTGYATGPHLHFGLYWAPSVIMKSIPPAAGLVPIGVVVNPEDYL
ncbi:MAG: peptidoglycan DD-metalloendopeptidase family protein [Candidatus Liptonbacteria bacterium]|nr:peptidoglycan DD-metalloendopeptidase family protein [Candidatus Liptonbacteria bacterium]